jgi:pyruvate dehydrogenase E2 component (dihydrolipoamide acetyltransferase)
MASRVVMPKLSDTMEEGRILRWIKKEGDRVETGQALAEVETDKATVEMEAYTTGVVRKLIATEGQVIQVGSLIAVIGSPDEDVSALVSEQPAAAAPKALAKPASVGSTRPAGPEPAPAPAPAAGPRLAPAPAATQSAAATGRSLRASPLALRMAAESGVDLSGVRGSGPQGRIIKRDIESAMAASRGSTVTAPPTLAAERPRRATPPPGREGVPESQDVELSTMRRTIAKRLVQSKGPVPHFYLTVDLAMDRTWEAYRALHAEQSPITVNDIVIKATATALRRHPEVNASFAGDHVKRYNRVHIGVAVAVEDGLITPVVRDADTMTLEEISAEVKALADRARARRLQPHEYTGATFSISNLGMMGIEEFSAIINPPEAAILAVGAVRQTPVVENGQVKVGYRMKVTLSVDHRVIDGTTGARFLQTLRRLLENPLLIG